MLKVSTGRYDNGIPVLRSIDRCLNGCVRAGNRKKCSFYLVHHSNQTDQRDENKTDNELGEKFGVRAVAGG